MADNKGVTEFEFTFSGGLQPNRSRVSNAPYIVDMLNTITYSHVEGTIEPVPNEVNISLGGEQNVGTGLYYAMIAGAPDNRLVWWQIDTESTNKGVRIYYRTTVPQSGNSPTPVVPSSGNITDGLRHSIVRINGMTLFFNGVNQPWKDDTDYTGAFNFPTYLSDIGVNRPNITTPGKTQINISLSTEAISADVGAFMYKDGTTWTDETTDANSAGTNDTRIFPDYTTFSDWLGAYDWRDGGGFSDGHYIGYATRFGGIEYQMYTGSGTTGTSEGLRYEWQYLSQRGSWEPVENPVYRTTDDGVEISNPTKNFFHTSVDTKPIRTVSWDLPEVTEDTARRKRWKKQELNNLGPFYWVRCVKISGNLTTQNPIANEISVFGGEVQGNVKGVVRYFISEMTDTAESALSDKIPQNDTPGTQEIDCGEGAAVKISIDVDSGNGEYANYQSKKFKVYRTFANGYQPFDTGLRIETDAVAEGLVVDEVPDAELGDLPYLHGDKPLPGFISAVSHYGRVWAITKEGDLYWSDLANVESWWTSQDSAGRPEGNAISVFRDDNDEATCLARDRDGLVVFKQSHMYRVLGRVPDQLNLYEVTPSDGSTISLGTPSIASVCTTPAGLCFYWNKAVYIYTGGYNAVRISDPISSILDGISMVNEYWGIALGYDAGKDHLYVSVNIGTDQTATLPTDTFIFDFRSKKWISRLNVGYANYTQIPGRQELVTYTTEGIGALR